MVILPFIVFFAMTLSQSNLVAPALPMLADSMGGCQRMRQPLRGRVFAKDLILYAPILFLSRVLTGFSKKNIQQQLNLGASPQLECWPALVQFVFDLTYGIAIQI